MTLIGKKYLLVICLLILSSCVKKSQISDQDRLKIKIQVAHLSDVPMPLGSQPVLKYISDNSFGYLISDQTDLLQYYLVELYQYGWDLIGQFDGQFEQNLIFEKPHKLLSIIIRKQDDQWLVLIFSKEK